MKSPLISKSKYLSGLQCPKLLWHQYNAKEVSPKVDEATQAIFDQGHLVGELAKKLFPGGIEVEAEHTRTSVRSMPSPAPCSPSASRCSRPALSSTAPLPAPTYSTLLARTSGT